MSFILPPTQRKARCVGHPLVMLLLPHLENHQTRFGSRLIAHNHPFARAILAASTRFAAPSLLIASDK